MARGQKKGGGPTPAEARYRKILKEHERGVSLTTLARRHGLKRSTLVWWKWQLGRRDRDRRSRRLRKAKGVPQLVPVRFEPTSAAAPPRDPNTERFEVLLRSGRAVRVPPGFDDGELGRLVRVLEADAC